MPASSTRTPSSIGHTPMRSVVTSSAYSAELNDATASSSSLTPSARSSARLQRNVARDHLSLSQPAQRAPSFTRRTYASSARRRQRQPRPASAQAAFPEFVSYCVLLFSASVDISLYMERTTGQPLKKTHENFPRYIDRQVYNAILSPSSDEMLNARYPSRYRHASSPA